MKRISRTFSGVGKMDFYDRIAKYYDLAQEQKSWDAKVWHLDNLLRRRGVQTVLDLACGTGAHLIELARLGYRCMGQDLCRGMIEVAREKTAALGLMIDFFQGDLRTFRSSRIFDAVLAINVLSSQEDDGDFCAALVSARKALRPGGVFAFNVLNAEARPRSAPEALPMPQLFLTAAAQKGEVEVIRFHNLALQGDLLHLTGIFLIEDEGKTRLEIQEDKLRLRRLDDIKALLADQGFHFEAARYVDGMGFKEWDVHVWATAKGDG